MLGQLALRSGQLLAARCGYGTRHRSRRDIPSLTSAGERHAATGATSHDVWPTTGRFASKALTRRHRLHRPRHSARQPLRLHAEQLLVPAGVAPSPPGSTTTPSGGSRPDPRVGSSSTSTCAPTTRGSGPPATSPDTRKSGSCNRSAPSATVTWPARQVRPVCVAHVCTTSFRAGDAAPRWVGYRQARDCGRVVAA